MPSHYEVGPYKAKVIGQRFGMTPNQSAYFAIQFEPTQATGANGFPNQVYAREVTLYITEKAHTYTIEKLRSLGWEGTKFSELDPSSQNHHSFVGLEIDVVCSLNDKGYDEWNLAYSGQETPDSDPTVAGRLDNLFGKALMSSIPAKKADPRAEPVAPKDCPF